MQCDPDPGEIISMAAVTPPCAITIISICVHVKEPVVHVRVQWIMETLQIQHTQKVG